MAIFFIDFKLLGCDESLNEKLVVIGLKIVTDRDYSASRGIKIANGLFDLIFPFAQSNHNPRLDKPSFPRFFCIPKDRKSSIIGRFMADARGQFSNRLNIVIKDFGLFVEDDVDGAK